MQLHTENENCRSVVQLSKYLTSEDRALVWRNQYTRVICTEANGRNDQEAPLFPLHTTSIPSWRRPSHILRLCLEIYHPPATTPFCLVLSHHKSQFEALEYHCEQPSSQPMRRPANIMRRSFIFHAIWRGTLGPAGLVSPPDTFLQFQP